MAVKLDQYQTIVNVHWPATTPFYVIMETGLYQNIVDGVTLQSFGTYTGPGLPLPPGAYDSGYYDNGIISYIGSTGVSSPVLPYEAAGGYVLVSSATALGEAIPLTGIDPIVSGHPALPEIITLGAGFAGGATGYPIEHYLETATTDVDIPGHTLGTWKSPELRSIVTAYTVGAADDYNPNFPTPPTPAGAKLAFIGANQVVASTSIIPSIVVLSGHNYVPIGARVFAASVVGQITALRAQVICQIQP